MARPTDRYIAQNRKARHDYLIEDTIEAGLILAGSEVKSLRKGGVSINEAYAAERGGELYLMNANIPEYAAARINHEPRPQAPAAQEGAEPARGRRHPRGHDAGAARALLQRARHRQDRDRPRQGQTQGRQARRREGARLEAGQSADLAGTGGDR